MDEKETGNETKVTAEDTSTTVKEDTSNASPKNDSPFDNLAQSLAELKAVVKIATEKKAADRGISDEKQKIARLEEEIQEFRKRLDHASAETSRKGEFSEDTLGARGGIPTASFKSLMDVQAASGSEVEMIQRANDDMYIIKSMFPEHDVRNSAAVINYFKSTYPTYAKSMNTGSGVGAEWIPTGFSRNLVELVKLNLRVAALHPRFDMPTNPYTFPVEGADIAAYAVAEQTGNDADLDANNRVPSSTPATSNLSFSASKVGVRVVVSTEITEDSIVPILPFVRSKIITALANAQENTVINGDIRLAGGIDGITGTTTDQRLAYNGYRRAVQLAGTTSDASTFNLAAVRKLRTDMGVYGVDTGQLCYVVGVNGYNSLLSLSEVTTIDKIGPRATILNGQIGAIDGVPIILSEYVSETLDGTGELAGTGTKTELLLVHKGAYMFGDRRQITLKSKERIETDQQVLVALQRLDFKPLYTPSASNTISSAGVNISIL